MSFVVAGVKSQSALPVTHNRSAALKGAANAPHSLAAEMGEVEQRELRLAERNKVLQMNKITGFYRENGIYSICPRCKNRIKLSVETMFFAAKLSEKITCIDCDADLILKIELLDCAAELPLERTGDTPKACFVSHKSIWDDDDNSYLFCPYCGERLSS